MPRASAADAARTAARVLEAATRRFTSDGYAEASIEAVAAEAHVTRGAVYHHFRDRRGLLLAVVRAGHERVAEHVRDQAQTHQDDAASLRAGCHAFVDAVTQDPAARLLLVDGPAALGWQAWRDLDAQTSERELREALTALVDPEDLEATTQLLSGAMNEAALWIAADPDDPRRPAAAHRTLDRLLDAVVAPAEPTR